jgi:squalene-hopene/tetraprenyl-beta-curcumene cyclase
MSSPGFRSAFLAAALLASTGLPAGTIQESIARGAKWLASGQNPDGGYGPYGEGPEVRVRNASDVGITAFALYALAKSKWEPRDSAPISRAADFLLSRQQTDGGFYDTKDPTLQNYKTSVVVMALSALDRAKYSGPIAKAQAFIKLQQFAEEDGLKPDKDLLFGGVGYGSKQRPDLSNTNVATDALKESGLSGSDELWSKLVVFVARCQNAETVDPLLKEMKIGTTKDGGFRYAPDETRGAAETLDDGTKIFSSYGSMTYAALKALLYANVKRSDKLVTDAFAWISKSFTVKENPGMATKGNPKSGLNGLFYYYHTMSKALAAYGEAVIKDSKGVEHRWAQELSDHLISIQHADGGWQNTSDRWYENIAVLDTAYAMVSLAVCQEELARQAQPKAKDN